MDFFRINPNPETKQFNWLENLIYEHPIIATIILFLVLVWVFVPYKKIQSLPKQTLIGFRKIEKWTIKNRAISTLVAGFLSYFIFRFALEFLQNSAYTTEPSLLTLFIPFITAPVLFVLWIFRDDNQQQTIANQRKDTNLKDFQQLQQWATGNFGFSDVSDSQDYDFEKTKQTGANPEIKIQELKDNRLTLQISALHQLRPFLKGDYGDNFKRATFEIYAALLKQTHQKILQGMDLSKINSYSVEEQIKNNGLANALKRIVEEEKESFFNQKFQYQSLSLVGMNLRGFEFKKINNKPIDLSNANLIAADLSEADLQRANLQMAKLSGADLSEADLSEAKLYGADLSEADLSEAKLQDADLQMADLKEAKLQGANLERANLQRADLRGAYLSRAYLLEADLSGAYLLEADLQGAILNGAKLQGAKLQGAKLQGVNLLDISDETLNDKKAEQIINELEKLKNGINDTEMDQKIKKVREDIGKSKEELIKRITDEATTGSYNQAEADELIKQYKQ